MKWDMFISHASEDKAEVVEPLVKLLTKRGYKIWYDDYNIRVGDSITSSIREGLAKSNYGLLILSKHFINKDWPKKELNALETKELYLGSKILPVWHKISHKELIEFSPSLADTKALIVNDNLDNIVDELCEIVVRDTSLKRVINDSSEKIAVGDFNDAVMNVARSFEKELKQLAIKKLSSNYFKHRKLRMYTFGGIITLLERKKIIKLRTYHEEIDVNQLIKIRNDAAHIVGSIDREKALYFISEIEKMAIINEI